MVDYTEKLRQDLLEQFKEKPVIDALICAVGEQLTDLHRFFTALRDERGVLTAIGKQLDGVGDIVGAEGGRYPSTWWCPTAWPCPTSRCGSPWRKSWPSGSRTAARLLGWTDPTCCNFPLFTNFSGNFAAFDV